MKGMIVGATIALGSAFVGYIVGAGVAWNGRANWWEVLTAVGTFGTVLIAAGVAINELRQGRQERRASKLKTRTSTLSQLWASALVAHETATNFLDSNHRYTQEDLAKLEGASSVAQSVRAMAPDDIGWDAYSLHGILATLIGWNRVHSQGMPLPPDRTLRQTVFEDARDLFLKITNERDAARDELDRVT